jgi:hypothetical protein
VKVGCRSWLPALRVLLQGFGANYDQLLQIVSENRKDSYYYGVKERNGDRDGERDINRNMQIDEMSTISSSSTHSADSNNTQPANSPSIKFYNPLWDINSKDDLYMIRIFMPSANRQFTNTDQLWWDFGSRAMGYEGVYVVEPPVGYQTISPKSGHQVKSVNIRIGLPEDVAGTEYPQLQVSESGLTGTDIFFHSSTSF